MIELTYTSEDERWNDSMWTGRQVELVVFYITGKTDTKVMEHITQGKTIDDEAEGPKDKTLGHTSRGGEKFKIERLKSYDQSAVREVRFEPAKGSTHPSLHNNPCLQSCDIPDILLFSILFNLYNKSL